MHEEMDMEERAMVTERWGIDMRPEEESEPWKWTGKIKSRTQSMEDIVDAQSLQKGGLLVFFREELDPWIKKASSFAISTELCGNRDQAICEQLLGLEEWDPDGNRDLCKFFLHAFVRDGNLHKIEDFLEKLNVDEIHFPRRDYGTTLLHTACNEGNLPVVEVLLDAGADIFHFDNDWESPLHCAARRGSLDIVRALIERFPDPKSYLRAPSQVTIEWMKNLDRSDTVGMTALELAIWHGHADVVKFLLEAERKAFGDDQDETWDRFFDEYPRPSYRPKPMFLACYAGRVEVLRCFVEELNIFRLLSLMFFKRIPAADSGRDLVNFMTSIKQQFTEMELLCGESGSLPLAFEATLDEYCNPEIGPEILNQRNMDQVVVRYLTGQRRENPKQDSDPILMVPQACIWSFDDHIIASSELLAEKLGWGPTIMKNLMFRLHSEDVTHKHLIGILLSECINSLDTIRGPKGRDPGIFAIFARSIARVSEEVNIYLTPQNMSDINIEKEKDFLHHIEDIRDELSMIQTILIQQEEVWREFMFTTWPNAWPNGPEGSFKPPQTAEAAQDGEVWKIIQRPQQQLPKFKRRLQKLDDDAQRVQRSIELRLDLKQKHASLNEARLASLMSASVFGFTIVTIIFTPLSFLAGLFALPIEDFQRHQTSFDDGNSTVYTTQYIGKWFATAEIVSFHAIHVWLASMLEPKRWVSSRKG
ncbi:hypothetical protein INS49_001745 [Diaporthe citri]|uniref:uncharacterized protein n=1 Tax=Diaporthe citri TaxID=83186 RepID=UPI001C802F07|nr:uncharacterized protein INS49_001745 [Diaporthe citri]KAG6367552.1 hypothetical protein INS49_001745 [Diaporthe citri]